MFAFFAIGSGGNDVDPAARLVGFVVSLIFVFELERKDAVYLDNLDILVNISVIIGRRKFIRRSSA